MLLTGHALWRVSHRTELSREEIRIILDERAYVELGCVTERKTSYFLFYDGRQCEYLVGCVRDDSLVTVLPHQFGMPFLIQRRMTDKNFMRAKNLFYDVASPKFPQPCPATLDVQVTIRSGVKCLVENSRICRISRIGYDTVGTDEVFGLFSSEILHLFRTQNEAGILAYNSAIELQFYDHDECVVTRFQTTVRKFLNQYVTDEVSLVANLYVSYLGDVAILPFGVVPYSVVREKNSVWRYFAESLEDVIEKCEIRIPGNILSAVKYRLQISYESIMLSDWQIKSDHTTVCRILNYHPQ